MQERRHQWLPQHLCPELLLESVWQGLKKLQIGSFSGKVRLMAKKMVIYHVNENHGCMYYLIRGFGVLMVASILMYLLGYVAAIAVGIGLWFLSRLVWRRMVVEMPDNGIVRWGLGLAPIVRKVLGGAVCVFISLCLMLVWNSSLKSSSTSSDNSEAPTAESSISENNSADEKKESESGMEEKSAISAAILSFSDVKAEVTDNQSSYTVKASVTGTVKNDGQVKITSWKMPKLVRNDKWSDSATMDKDSLDPGESTTFTYEMNCDWDADYTWSFEVSEGIECVGLDGVAEELTNKFDENKQATAQAREEAAKRSAEEAEQRRAESEQQHFEASCYVTPSGHSYHESPGCPKLNGSTNLTEMTVEEARNMGYDPCDYCAS